MCHLFPRVSRIIWMTLLMLVTTDFYLFINAWAHETMPEQIRQNNTQWQCECTKHPKYTTQRKFISSSCGQAGITSLKWKLCHTSKSRTKMTHRCNWCLFLMFSDAKPHSQLANWQIVVWFFFCKFGNQTFEFVTNLHHNVSSWVMRDWGIFKIEIK